MLQPLKPPKMDSRTPTPLGGSLGRILGNLKGTLKFSPEALWGPKISILWKLGSNDLYTSFEVLYLGFPMSYV